MIDQLLDAYSKIARECTQKAEPIVKKPLKIYDGEFEPVYKGEGVVVCADLGD